MNTGGLSALDVMSTQEALSSSAVHSGAPAFSAAPEQGVKAREQQAVKFIEGRIGNDLFLDLKEEQEYFAWVNDQLDMSYDEANQLLMLVLEQRGATRQRTATQTFREALEKMLDDQYLDAAEVKRAHQLGRSLGLDRADEGFGFIEQIMQEELQKAVSYTHLTLPTICSV